MASVFKADATGIAELDLSGKLFICLRKSKAARLKMHLREIGLKAAENLDKVDAIQVGAKFSEP